MKQKTLTFNGNTFIFPHIIDQIRGFHSLEGFLRECQCYTTILYNGVFQFGTVALPTSILKYNVSGLKKHVIWKYIYMYI